MARDQQAQSDDHIRIAGGSHHRYGRVIESGHDRPVVAKVSGKIDHDHVGIDVLQFKRDGEGIVRRTVVHEDDFVFEIWEPAHGTRGPSVNSRRYLAD